MSRIRSGKIPRIVPEHQSSCGRRGFAFMQPTIAEGKHENLRLLPTCNYRGFNFCETKQTQTKD